MNPKDTVVTMDIIIKSKEEEVKLLASNAPAIPLPLHQELVDAILSFMEPVGSKNDPLRFRRDSDKFSSVSDGKFDKDKGIIQDLDVLSNQLQCLENLCR